MTVRRILIFLPVLIICFLLQSYLWVPTYEEQTRGNPKRLHDYITGSIGDASILNPILHADSASGDITGMVFEGLIDRDEELRFRGRLATSWDIYEEAFFYVNEKIDIPGVGKARAEELVKLLQEAKKQDPILVFKNYLYDSGVLNDEKHQEIVERIQREVDEATEYAENAAYPEPESTLLYVYEE